LDWLKPEKARSYFATLLERVGERAQQIVPHSNLKFTEENLLREYQRSPHKVRAFIQALTESDSPDMLLMAWRVLQGMEIERVELNYILSQRFAIRVTLRSPYGDEPEIYTSDDIDDAALIRHFGIMKMDEKPVFDGFYPSSSARSGS